MLGLLEDVQDEVRCLRQSSFRIPGKLYSPRSK
ncbi:hypothetical protein BCCR75502_01249 [Burkholderia sola]|nr:hypothetical protein BCCR75389_01235 [Burkholderia cenocepacia]CAG2266203.1 hypothetical protein BCCR75386_01250 [Burkholderia cenocepacia]CAG2266381.1 hypothetical protein BCCR75388_01251 [Burkholderia cenocepacia]CAG2266586.1 hypothetical protein BCCR75384_01251 [Burkholderia cenocepacia]CAG2266634.1 hypothetical protein BCCR75387_01251 [Burkholderia cenocepacia]